MSRRGNACPSRSKKNQDAVDLRFRLVALAPRGMVEKRLGNRALSIELPKQINIRRFGIHSRLSDQTPILTGMCLCWMMGSALLGRPPRRPYRAGQRKPSTPLLALRQVRRSLSG